MGSKENRKRLNTRALVDQYKLHWMTAQLCLCFRARHVERGASDVTTQTLLSFAFCNLIPLLIKTGFSNKEVGFEQTL